MVLGNTYDTIGGYQRLVAEGAEIEPIADPPGWRTPRRAGTWFHLATVLDAAGIDPAACWCTNAYPGLLNGNRGNTGPAKVRPNSDLGRFCDNFFAHSLKLLKPSSEFLATVRGRGQPLAGPSRAVSEDVLPNGSSS